MRFGRAFPCARGNFGSIVDAALLLQLGDGFRFAQCEGAHFLACGGHSGGDAAHAHLDDLEAVRLVGAFPEPAPHHAERMQRLDRGGDAVGQRCGQLTIPAADGVASLLVPDAFERQRVCQRGIEIKQQRVFDRQLHAGQLVYPQNAGGRKPESLGGFCGLQRCRAGVRAPGLHGRLHGIYGDIRRSFGNLREGLLRPHHGNGGPGGLRSADEPGACRSADFGVRIPTARRAARGRAFSRSGRRHAARARPRRAPDPCRGSSCAGRHRSPVHGHFPSGTH